jgi:hypothetical protein
MYAFCHYFFANAENNDKIDMVFNLEAHAREIFESSEVGEK